MVGIGHPADDRCHFEVLLRWRVGPTEQDHGPTQAERAGEVMPQGVGVHGQSLPTRPWTGRRSYVAGNRAESSGSATRTVRAHRGREPSLDVRPGVRFPARIAPKVIVNPPVSPRTGKKK